MQPLENHTAYGKQNFARFPRRTLAGFMRRRFFAVSWFAFFITSLFVLYDVGLVPNEILLWGDGVIPSRGVLEAPFIYSAHVVALGAQNAGKSGAAVARYAHHGIATGIEFGENFAADQSQRIGAILNTSYDRARAGALSVDQGGASAARNGAMVAGGVASRVFRPITAISLPAIHTPEFSVFLPRINFSPVKIAAFRTSRATSASAKVATHSITGGIVRGVSGLASYVALLGDEIKTHFINSLATAARAMESSFFGTETAVTVRASETAAAAISSEVKTPVADEKSPAPIIREGRLHIASIGLDTKLVFPTSTSMTDLEDVLETGPARHPLSALPGEQGNVFLMGHSSRIAVNNKPMKVFNKLPDITTGEAIIIDYGDRSYEYRAASMRIAEAADAVISLKGEKPRLTLTTCWLFDNNKEDRYILEAEFVRSYPQARQSGASVDTSS